jgi:hypothetical protein
MIQGGTGTRRLLLMLPRAMHPSLLTVFGTPVKPSPPQAAEEGPCNCLSWRGFTAGVPPLLLAGSAHGAKAWCNQQAFWRVRPGTWGPQLLAERLLFIMAAVRDHAALPRPATSQQARPCSGPWPMARHTASTNGRPAA